jgi:hypothetical protein
VLPTKNRIEQHQKDFILKKMGCNFKDAQIIKMVHDEYGITVNPGTMYAIRHRAENQNKINRFRKEFESHVVDVELASKRRRVEELNWIYYQFKEKDQLEKCMKSLAQIQTELEGKGTGETTYQFNQFINMTNEEIRQKLMENAKKLLELEGRSAPAEVPKEEPVLEAEVCEQTDPGSETVAEDQMQPTEVEKN